MTKRGALRNRGEWLLVAGTLGLLRALPGRVGVALVGAAGRLGNRLLGERREVARRNVEQSLGVSRAEARRIVAGAFRGLALNLVETKLLERSLARRPLTDHVAIEGAEHMEQALAAGRGVLVASAHLGGWECLAMVLGRRFRRVWAVARPLDNPFLERMAAVMRQRVLAGTLDKDGGGLKMARLIKAGEVVGLLLDQNAGHEGVMLDFLGRPSWHHRVPGIMACRLGAVVLPTYLLREPGYLRFRLVIERPITPDPSLPPELAETEVVRRISRSLEDRVREAPEQWLWLHDRWRRAERSLSRGGVRAGDREAAQVGLANSTSRE